MKKSTILYFFCLLLTLFSSCKEPFYFEQDGYVDYKFDVEELMSDFPTNSLTLIINLDIENLHDDIFADAREQQPGLDVYPISINSVDLGSSKLRIEQSEENISEIVKSKLVNIELILNDVTTFTKTVIAEYKESEVTDDLVFNSSNFSFSVEDLKDHKFEYYFRLTFSEKPELDFLKLFPEVSFYYDCVFQE